MKRNDQFLDKEQNNTATVRRKTVTAISLVWSCDFLSVFSQNGQTAQSVAEGASHQDIVDLLKAQAETQASEPSTTTDLLWARPTLFTSPNHPSKPTPNPSVPKTLCSPTKRENVELWMWWHHTRLCLTSGKMDIYSVYHGTTYKPMKLECPAVYAHISLSSTSLPTCPVGVYGYAALTTQWTENKKKEAVGDKMMP